MRSSDEYHIPSISSPVAPQPTHDRWLGGTDFCVRARDAARHQTGRATESHLVGAYFRNGFGASDESAVAGFPWLTPVVGPGCLGIFPSSTERIDVQYAIDSIKRALTDPPSDPHNPSIMDGSARAIDTCKHITTFMTQLLLAANPGLDEPGEGARIEIAHSIQLYLIDLAWSTTRLYKIWVENSDYPIGRDELDVALQHHDSEVRRDDYTSEEDHLDPRSLLRYVQEVCNKLFAIVCRPDRHGRPTQLIDDQKIDKIVATIMLPHDTPEARTFRESIVDIGRTRDSLYVNEREFVKGIFVVLAAIQDDLRDNPPHISRISVSWLADAATQLFLLGSPVYTGWRSMVRHLLLRTATDNGRRAPNYPPHALQASGRLLLGDLAMELKTAAQALASYLIEPTISSIQAGDSPRRTFYATLPSNLNAHYDVWKIARKISEVATAESHDAIPEHEMPLSNQVPYPTAFVCSFDIELEIAFIRAGKPFNVALPLHVAERDTSTLMWAYTHFEPAKHKMLGPNKRKLIDDVSDLLEVKEFHLLPDEPSKMMPGPLVLRLDGGPLYNVSGSAKPQPRDPDESNPHERRPAPRAGERPTILHAIALDEYYSMLSSHADYFWATRAKTSNQSRLASTGLPSWTILPDVASTRYWFFAGLQLTDSLVRQRFFSALHFRYVRHHDAHGHISARSEPYNHQQSDSHQSHRPADAAGSTGEPADLAYTPVPPVQPSPTASTEGPPPTIADEDGDSPLRVVGGVAVNREVSAEDSYLLRWLGLDVVEDDAASFTKDLQHFSLHVQHLLDPDLRAEFALRPPTAQCSMEERRV